ncbi:MAG: response regulator [Chlorobiaceae bacterium]|nr:response regulator [Chlorobiaceae bacterium]
MDYEQSQLKRSVYDDWYRDLFLGMRYGCLCCQVIYNEEGIPVDFIHQEANASYARLTGLNDVIGLKASEVFPDIHLSHPGFIEKHLRVAETGISDNFEFYLEPLQKWFDISIYSSWKDHFSVIIDEITDRKTALYELKKSEERFKTLFESHSAIKIVLDSETGYIIDANQAAADFYGWSIDELCRMNIQQINTLPAESVNAEMKKTVSGEKTHFFFIHRLASGVLRDVEVFSNKIVIEGKSLLHSIIHDVTEQKIVEAEREKLQAQLQHSQKMEMVGQLAGGIAHDFNNMLGVISGHAEMAIESGIFSLDDLESIQKAAVSSANLTRQLLAFARKQPVSPKSINLNEAIEGMLSFLRRLIGEDIALEWNPCDQESLLYIDPSQIDQILTNLSVNARDAIDGIGTITITTSRHSHDDAACHFGLSCDLVTEYATITFADSGCGIDSEHLPHIFEPYFTTKEVGKGTGLGLSTLYGIVKQNNGYVEYDSSYSEGTTFHIHLPRYHAAAGEVRYERSEPAVLPAQNSILLVEDQEDILKMCKRMLEQQGYTVLPAATPNAAIRIAFEHQGSLDLLLTDVVMPGMNGSDLAKTVTTISPGIKTLFMSGYTADTLAARGVSGDGVDFIQKPFTVKQLTGCIQELLSIYT